MADSTDLVIYQGRTFSHLMRWMGAPYVYKPITGITQAAPAIVTCVGHGIPDGWPVAIVSVKGMTEINALATPPKQSEYKRGTVKTADTIELNTVNSSDFSPYENGGYVQYRSPIDLAGSVGRMKIKDKVGGNILASTDPADGVTLITMTLDNVLKTITAVISAADTALITWLKGVYDIEIDNAGVVKLLKSGKITVVREVTTN